MRILICAGGHIEQVNLYNYTDDSTFLYVHLGTTRRKTLLIFAGVVALRFQHHTTLTSIIRVL